MIFEFCDDEAAVPFADARRFTFPQQHAHPVRVSMLSVIATVLWVVFAAAGIIGLYTTFGRPTAIKKILPPIAVERLNVNVVNSEARSSAIVMPAPHQPLPAPQAAQAIPSPALAPVADPKLSIPFPIAVKGPSKIVELSRAAPSRLQSFQAATAVDHLTFGKGEGDQPAPDYPREAKLAHQQGNVIVQMTIGEKGDVSDAKITSPCQWPILNQAALRAVRDTWHFGKGPIRFKDIEFVFELHQQ